MAHIDLRTVRFLDGLQLSFEMLDLLKSELQQVVARAGDDRSSLARALWQCWSFVDVVHRIRDMAQAMPQVSRKASEVSVFLSETRTAESFRHYIQHLRSELAKRDLNTFPVWGSLSWVDLDDALVAHLVVAGAATPETRFTGCVFDMAERRWVSNVTLGVEGLSFNFDPIYESCVAFRGYVVPRLKQILGDSVRYQPKAPVVSMRVVLGGQRDA